jgi:exodeoxyribonuclease VII large subunit
VPLQTSADKPAPLRTVSDALGSWIDKLGWVWVEAQIAELNRRQGRVFLTLRDTAADLSVQAMCSAMVLDSVATPVTEGARVVVHAKPRYYDRRGSLSLVLDQIRPVGQGELLARIEQRRRLLAAEGLFASDRKRRLPFLPGLIGLVTGRDSAAERDVVSNARRRWPGVAFRVEYAVVQGVHAAREVIEALRRLEADPAVDVIVVARGGGSLEDLLAFSDEGLVRVVAALRTPVVSAIGHEQDNPILDLVADLRASTPTDAAKSLVPDVSEEERTVRQMTARLRRAVHQRLAAEERQLAALRSRPCLAAPYALVEQRRVDVIGLSSRSRRVVRHRLERAADDLGHSVARVRALSPLATLQRGYAVATTSQGHVLTGVGDAHAGDAIAVRLHDGRLAATVTSADSRSGPVSGARTTPGESAS